MSDGRKKIGLAAVAVLVTWALTVVGVVWAVSSERTALSGDVRRSAQQIKDHEQRLRAIESQVPQIARDVSWIRQALERRHP